VSNHYFSYLSGSKHPAMKNISLKIIPLLILYIISSQSKGQLFTNPEVIKIADGFQFVEGPVWVESLGLLFSDIPANTVYLWTEEEGAEVYFTPSGNSNGLAMDNEGRLILCQHGPRQVAYRESDGSIIPLATHYDGKRLNSPNDLAIHSDGSVYFTDPPYGLNDQGGTSELGFYGIYRLSPSGDLQLLDSTVNRPNGIAFSPDESKLYVTDSESRQIFIWDVDHDTTISNKTEFAYQEPFGYTDGMKVDDEGYIYSSGPVGIWVYDPDGTALDTIAVPGQTSNCAIGDSDGKGLFVTSGDAVYRIRESEGPVATLPIRTWETQLLPAYPNPFRHSTVIPFYLEEGQPISIEIYNASGERVSSLLNTRLEDGYHAIKWNSKDLECGIYYVNMALSGKRVQDSYRVVKM
jgi:sugar lactone lactonase YvrE